MKRSHIWLLVICLVLGCARGESLYTAKSKDHGAPFDLVITEVKREPAVSFVSVPGFHTRTAAGSRWLMCMYNDLAAKRGFKYWTVIYPEEPKETFPIAFYQNADEDLRKLLGSEYVVERALPPIRMPTSRYYETICGWMK